MGSCFTKNFELTTSWLVGQQQKHLCNVQYAVSGTIYWRQLFKNFNIWTILLRCCKSSDLAHKTLPCIRTLMENSWSCPPVFLRIFCSDHEDKMPVTIKTLENLLHCSVCLYLVLASVHKQKQQQQRHRETWIDPVHLSSAQNLYLISFSKPSRASRTFSRSSFFFWQVVKNFT